LRLGCGGKCFDLEGKNRVQEGGSQGDSYFIFFTKYNSGVQTNGDEEGCSCSTNAGVINPYEKKL
jgi:hypothetical protein